MRWFENFTIRKKLLCGFGLGLFMVIALAIYAITQLSAVNRNYKDTVGASDLNVEIITLVNNNFMQIRLDSRDMIINIENASAVANLSSNTNKLYNEIKTKLNDYVNMIKDPKTATLATVTVEDINALNTSLAGYMGDISKIDGLINEQKTAEAIALLEQMKTSAQSISTTLAASYEKSIDSSNDLIDKNSRDSAMAVWIMIAISVAAAIFVFSATFYVARSIAVPLRKLRNDAQEVSNGNLGVVIATNRRDEIGQLANGFSSVVDTFRMFGSEVRNMYEQIDGKGDIDSRIDESKFVNDYQNLAKEINNTIDNIIKDILSGVSVMNAYANGDFSVVCQRFIGKKASIHLALDLLRDNLSLVNREINALAVAAGNGDLDARVSTDKFNGDWKKLAESLNTLVECILTPINETVKILDLMSEGNLHVTVDGDYKGEFGKLKNSINTTTGMIRGYILEITDILSKMANEDLTAEIKTEYLGDFAAIKDSINLILQSFNTVLAEINMSADQVASGARQISESSMTLAQGASEQANSVDLLTTTLEAINIQTIQNAENAENANRLAASAKETADAGNDEMHQMLDAMRDINESSQNISKIIKVIEEIALQTNLLALNAAVEAAHAGKHGKGFTVVADQVRNLAGRSQEAAKQTTALIEGTVEKVTHGMTIADQTAVMLEKIVEQISNISSLAGGVATASHSQADAIGQVNLGIGQISQVTQINSATSQEEAASSQELSSQAELFRNMVSRFKLRSKTSHSSKQKYSGTGNTSDSSMSGAGKAKAETKHSSSYSSPTTYSSYDSGTSFTKADDTYKPVSYDTPKKQSNYTASKPVTATIAKPVTTTKPAAAKPLTTTVSQPAAKPAHDDKKLPSPKSGALDTKKTSDTKTLTSSQLSSIYESKDFGKY